MTNEIPQPAYTTLLRQSIEYLDESLGQPQLIDSLGALGVSAVALQQRAAMLTVADVRTGATQRELDDHDGAEPRLFQCDHQVQSLDGWHRRDIIPLAIAPETRDVWTDMTDPMPLQRQQAQELSPRVPAATGWRSAQCPVAAWRGQMVLCTKPNSCRTTHVGPGGTSQNTWHVCCMHC